jgi:hypothetical protein
MYREGFVVGRAFEISCTAISIVKPAAPQNPER